MVIIDANFNTLMAIVIVAKNVNVLNNILIYMVGFQQTLRTFQDHKLL